MQQRPGPIIRPASSRHRRPTRRQIARRRATAAFAVIVLAFAAWQLWPSQEGSQKAGGRTPTGTSSSSTHAGNPGKIIPGENPIKHVIFLVKENRTFDYYFGKYPGADGATTVRP